MKTRWSTLRILTWASLLLLPLSAAGQGAQEELPGPADGVEVAAEEQAEPEAAPGDLRDGVLPAEAQPTEHLSGSIPDKSRRDAKAPDRGQERAGNRTFQGMDRRSGRGIGAPTSPRSDRRRTSGNRDHSPSGPRQKAGDSGGDFGAFRIIVERNIFDRNRSPRASRPGREDRERSTADTLTLVGTLSYEKGSYAFFDGSKPEFKKVLEIGKKIADHTIVAIAAGAIRLQANTNTVELPVGGRMRRGENGWEVVAGSITAATNANAASEPGSSSGADEGDIVTRLMRQREEELK